MTDSLQQLGHPSALSFPLFVSFWPAVSAAPPITLVLPDTLIAVPAGKDLPPQDRSRFAPPPAFSRLMVRGQWQSLQACEGDPLENWFWQKLSAIPAEQAGSAPEASSSGHPDVPPAWAMLDDPVSRPFTRWFVSPVHVGIGREGVSLLPPDNLQLSDEHARALNDLLVETCAGQGWSPVAAFGSRPAQWGCVLQSDQPLPQALPSPWAVARGRFTDLLPSGAGMADWRRLWMDLQMALHNHPVNQQRQQQGLPAVNAFWWWGGGESVPADAQRGVRLLAHDLASMGQGTETSDAGTPIGPESLHRCAAWLGSRLRTGSSGGGSVSGAGLVRLVENTNAAIWFGSAATHPAVQALDSGLLAPLAHAAAAHDLVLLGQSAWRTVSSGPALRWAIWKNRARPDDLLEPVSGLLDEGDLARAWQESARRATPDEGEFQPERF